MDNIFDSYSRLKSSLSSQRAICLYLYYVKDEAYSIEGIKSWARLFTILLVSISVMLLFVGRYLIPLVNGPDFKLKSYAIVIDNK